MTAVCGHPKYDGRMLGGRRVASFKDGKAFLLQVRRMPSRLKASSSTRRTVGVDVQVGGLRIVVRVAAVHGAGDAIGAIS